MHGIVQNNLPVNQHLATFFIFCTFWKLVFCTWLQPLYHTTLYPSLSSCVFPQIVLLFKARFQSLVSQVCQSWSLLVAAHLLRNAAAFRNTCCPHWVTSLQTDSPLGIISKPLKMLEEYQILMFSFMKYPPTRRRNKHFPYKQCIHYLCLLGAPSTDTCLWDTQIISLISYVCFLLFCFQGSEDVGIYPVNLPLTVQLFCYSSPECSICSFVHILDYGNVKNTPLTLLQSGLRRIVCFMGGASGS